MAENETIEDAAQSVGAEAAKAAKSRTTKADAAEAEMEGQSVRRDLEADLQALREDVARLGETVAAIAHSRADAIDAAVHRNPWSTAVAALCIGFCLGVRARR